MTLHLKIKPGSKVSQLLKDASGKWVLKVKAPPVDGKANAEAIRVLAEILDIPKSNILLTGGLTSSYKKFQINKMNEVEVMKKLNSYLGE